MAQPEAMIVSDLSDAEVKRLIERYEFQIRDAMRIVKAQPKFNLESRVALNAASQARRRLAMLKAWAA
jgi:hypothetical protein